MPAPIATDKTLIDVCRVLCKGGWRLIGGKEARSFFAGRNRMGRESLCLLVTNAEVFKDDGVMNIFLAYGHRTEEGGRIRHDEGAPPLHIGVPQDWEVEVFTPERIVVSFCYHIRQEKKRSERSGPNDRYRTISKFETALEFEYVGEDVAADLRRMEELKALVRSEHAANVDRWRAEAELELRRSAGLVVAEIRKPHANIIEIVGTDGRVITISSTPGVGSLLIGPPTTEEPIQV